MTDVIYFEPEKGRLVEMVEASNVGEGRLQQLLEHHPNLLAGTQIDQDHPRRWLLVGRELRIPSEEGGPGYWILDHLFLDQDGIPTIAEVKASTDYRIRREVIGQMLDYGASIRVYYPAERMRRDFEHYCDQNGIEPEQAVVSAVGRSDYEEYWQSVARNLGDGRIRMLFVADHLPPALRRVIEFLNEHLDSPEVLGVELKQYAGHGQRAYVPRVVGQTQKAMDEKSSRTRSVLREITAEEAIALIDRGCWAPEDVPICRRIVEWAKERDVMLRCWDPSPHGLYVSLPGFGHPHRGQLLFAAKMREGMCIELLGSLVTSPPFDEDGPRIELVNRLNAIGGIHLGEDEIRVHPHRDLGVFRDADMLEAFLATFDWVIEEFRRSR